MQLLLDTHAFLWFLADDERLSQSAQRAICDRDATIYVSLASAWEIAIKQKLGKLVFPEPLLAGLSDFYLLESWAMIIFTDC